MKRKVEVGDMNFLINQILAQLYSDPRNALVEFVTNAVESYREFNEGREQKTPADVEIYMKRRAHSLIKITDSGRGMNWTEIWDFPVKLAASVKRTAEYQQKFPDAAKKGIGKFGIGAWSFPKLGESMKIYTKQEGSPTFHLITNSRILPEVEIDVSGYTGIRDHGTHVIIENLKVARDPLMTPGMIKEHFGQKFREAFLSHDINALSITDTKGKRDYKITVEPAQYTGDLFPVKEISTPSGKIKVELYVLPRGWKQATKVAVIRRQRADVEDISKLPEFRNFPWDSNRVQGDITADFLESLPTRDSYERDERFAHFRKGVKSIEDEIVRYLKEKDELHKLEKTEKTASAISRIIAEVLQEAKFEIEPIPIKDKKEKVKGEVTTAEGIKPVEVDRPPRPPPKKPGEPVEPKEHIDRGEKEEGEVIKEKEEGKEKKVKYGIGIVFEQQKFTDEPYLHSKFIAPNIVLVNELHEDYEDAIKRDDEGRYFSYLALKELIIHYRDGLSTDSSIENFISLQIKSDRRLGRKVA